MTQTPVGSPRRLRPALAWALLVVLGLCAVATWWPLDAPQLVAATARLADAARPEALPNGPPAALATDSAASGPGSALPKVLPRPQIERARFDPFMGVTSPPPGPVKATQKLSATPLMPPNASAPAPPPVAAAPVMSYRYLGQLVDPSGRKLVYLAREDAAVLVAQGSRLEEGYVVEAIDQAAVRLHYPPLDLHLAIPVPPPPPSTGIR